MNKIEKLKLVLKLIKEHNLTAYEIGKNTKISTFAIQKIISGDTKNPNDTTLDVILDFIEEAILGSDIKPNKTEEPSEKYNQPFSGDLAKEYQKCMHESINQLKYIDYLKTLLRKSNIEFEE
jgi:hypothetical protein